MRFGLFIPQGWRMDLVGIPPQQHWGVMAGLARAADASEAWDSIWVYDHLHTVPEPTDQATHEAWSLTSALAAVTGRVRLGQMHTTVGYRNPVLLAKTAATVDVISEGRLDVGVGAGWYEHEWLAYGYGFPPAAERIGMLAEGLDLLRQAWTTGRATLDGEYYLANRAVVQPRPLQGTHLPGSQRNGIPLWVAGGGENKTLRLAARYADYTNFDGEPEAFARKSEVLAQYCREVGTDYDAITRSASYNVVLGDNDRVVAARLELIKYRMTDHGVTQAQADAQVEALRTQPLVGTPDKVSEALRELKGLGLGYALCYFPDIAYDLSGRDLFEHVVIPEVAGKPGRRRR